MAAYRQALQISPDSREAQQAAGRTRRKDAVSAGPLPRPVSRTVT